jgi:hypothetical protein
MPASLPAAQPRGGPREAVEVHEEMRRATNPARRATALETATTRRGLAEGERRGARVRVAAEVVVHVRP